MAAPTASSSSSSRHAGYSLWLVPTSSKERTILKNEMLALRHRAEQAARSPAAAPAPSSDFPPHVTLLSSLDHAADWSEDRVWTTLSDAVRQWRVETGAHSGSSLQCPLQELSTHGTYFQCLFLALQKTDQLMDLNDRMRTAFSARDQPTYTPHCSLLYAGLSEAEARVRIEQLLEDRIVVRQPDGGVAIGRSRDSSGRSARIDRITLDAIEMWDTNGQVDDWKMLRRMSL